MRVDGLTGVHNVRDLGGIPVRDNREVVEGLLFRGGALSGATDEDLNVLFGERGIRCVIDLRCGWELEEKPNRVSGSVEYLHIPFYDLEKVGIEYTESAEGTKVIGRDMACVPDHFYRHIANRLTTAQMRKALDAILEHALRGEPVYVHCSGGKDRAGIMSLVLLTVLGAGKDAIVEDYLLTNVSRDKRYEEMFERFYRFTGDAKQADELVKSHRARPENIDAFLQEIDGEYGSFASFMVDVLGMTEERRKSVVAQLTRPRHDL